MYEWGLRLCVPSGSLFVSKDFMDGLVDEFMVVEKLIGREE